MRYDGKGLRGDQPKSISDEIHAQLKGRKADRITYKLQIWFFVRTEREGQRECPIRFDYLSGNITSLMLH